METLYNNTTAASAVDDHPADVACFILNDPPNLLMSHKVNLYSSIIFVFIGIIGNILSMIVFSHKGMGSVSSNTYLFVLAVSDTLYLVSVFFTTILKNLRCFHFPDSPIDVINRSAIMCQLFQYFSDFFSDYSSCLILAFTIERCVAVYLPMRFKELCTVQRARIACIVIFSVIAAVIAPYHFLFMGKYTDKNGTQYDYCSIKNDDYDTKFMIMYITESLLFRIIPVIAIAILNVFIIVKVTKIAKDHRKRKAAMKNNRRNRKDEKNLQLTIMLILVSTTYVLAYLPVLFHFVFYYLHRHELIHANNNALLIAANYTRALYVSGFAMNFFLYTVSGRVFRERLEIILRCSLHADENKNGYVKTNADTEMTCM